MERKASQACLEHSRERNTSTKVRDNQAMAVLLGISICARETDVCEKERPTPTQRPDCYGRSEMLTHCSSHGSPRSAHKQWDLGHLGLREAWLEGQHEDGRLFQLHQKFSNQLSVLDYRFMCYILYLFSSSAKRLNHWLGGTFTPALPLRILIFTCLLVSFPAYHPVMDSTL